jgi:hypothetical protein
MNLPFLQFFFKILFVIGISLFFVQCASDDPAREAAQQAALEKANQPAATPPAEPERKPVRPPTTGSMTLQATGGKVDKGDEICVAVTAQDFKQIMSMQYTMKWDPKVLEFVNVKNFGLPGLSGNNFGGTQAKEGLLTFSWFDQNVQGISEDGGHKIYDVCFRAVGKSGSQTQFQFVDAPVIFEITNSASLFLDLNGIPGVVKVQ